MASMYVRVKRHKTALFLHVEPTDTVTQLKASIEGLLQEAPEAQRLYKDGALVEDGRTLAELKIENDDVLVLSLRQPDGSWEEPQVVDFNDTREDE